MRVEAVPFVATLKRLCSGRRGHSEFTRPRARHAAHAHTHTDHPRHSTGPFTETKARQEAPRSHSAGAAHLRGVSAMDGGSRCISPQPPSMSAPPRSEARTLRPGLTCFQCCAASKSRFLHPRMTPFPFGACVLRGTCHRACLLSFLGRGWRVAKQK